MTDNIFRNAIKTAMQDQKQTTRDMAKITGISSSMIHYFIKGTKDITSDKLIKLCEALNIKVSVESQL